MKKNLKKLFAILMTVAVVLSMAMPAMAAENNKEKGTRTVAPITDKDAKGTLVINEGTSADRTYTIYPVYTADIEGEGLDNTYTWNPVEGWTTTLPSAEKLIEYTAEQMKQLAQDLADEAKGDPKPVAAKESGVQDKVENLPLGYYLVVDDDNSETLEKSQPILVAIPQAFNGEWKYEIAITPKSSSTSFTKKIKEGTSLVDTNTKNIGEYVEYRLWADIPTYDRSVYSDNSKTLTFQITDNMSKQLTWDDSNLLQVYVIDSSAEADVAAANSPIAQEGNYTLTAPTTPTAGGSFTVAFTKAFMQENKGRVVVISFQAKLNNDAVIGQSENDKNNIIPDYEGALENNVDTNYNGKGNPNAAKLQYSNSFYGSDRVETIEDDVTTFTFDIDVHKVDKETGINLKDAEFTVYKTLDGAKDGNADDVYKNTLFTNGVLKTDASGIATASGLNKGTYYLKETQAPAGYKVFDGVIEVTIDATIGDDGTCTYSYTVKMGEDGTSTSRLEEVKVEDEEGTTLPGTGGIGTTIFTFGGLALIVLAGILLVVYTRKQKRA